MLDERRNRKTQHRPAHTQDNRHDNHTDRTQQQYSNQNLHLARFALLLILSSLISPSKRLSIHAFSERAGFHFLTPKKSFRDAGSSITTMIAIYAMVFDNAKRLN